MTGSITYPVSKDGKHKHGGQIYYCYVNDTRVTLGVVVKRRGSTEPGQAYLVNDWTNPTRGAVSYHGTRAAAMQAIHAIAARKAAAA